ncbi:hypothetical protein [Maribacter aestuarii]|uniref:hypothetical protein n=1 Tax=Maribacter aestuarii TaxID=1130723 RepID=UPI0025A59E4D|nr:hypothetical protein [Maribacter aestuarii]
MIMIHRLFWGFILCSNMVVVSKTVSAQDSYTPDLGLRKSIRQNVWEELKPLTPKYNQFLFNLVFKSNAYFEEYEKVATAKDYMPYNPTTVITFFSATCEEIRDTKTYSNEDLKIRFNSISLEKEHVSLSNTELQLKYDPMILKAMWLAQLAQSKNLKTGVAQNLAKKILENYNSSKVQDQTKVIAVASKSNKEQPSISKNNNKIHDVILRTVTSYGLNGAYVTNKVSILYENGDVYTNPTEPLEIFDIVTSKKENQIVGTDGEKKMVSFSLLAARVKK